MLNILFVCTGNICRSPMAEAFLRREAEKLSLKLDVRSSGTHALNGSPSPFGARLVMNECGVSMDGHRSTPLTDDLIEWADVIIGLGDDHVRALKIRYPDAGEKIFLMSTYVNGTAVEVEDPYGNSDSAYRIVCEKIELLSRSMAQQILQAAR